MENMTTHRRTTRQEYFCRATPDGFWELFQRAPEAPPDVFVNATFHYESRTDRYRVTFHVHDKNRYSLPSMTWSHVRCRTLTRHIKVDPCEKGRPGSSKVFFRKAKTLSDYISRIRTDKISRMEHDELFSVILETFHQKSFHNHNLDVPFLHFKQ